jgi:hypothetical protein
MSATQDVIEEKPIRSLSIRGEDLKWVRSECKRLNVKQVDFVGVMRRAWNSLPVRKRGTFIPSDQDEE